MTVAACAADSAIHAITTGHQVNKNSRHRPRSGPELALEPLLGLVDRALVRSRGEVLPATVGDDEHDIGTLTRLDRLRRLCESGVQDRTARQAGEQAFCVEQLAYTADRVAGRSEEHTSELQSRGHLVCRLLLEKKKH